MEAQAGIGLEEQLRQLTAIPPPAAAGSDEQSTPSVDMPPPCETGNGIASPLPISEAARFAFAVSSPIVARELPPVSPSDLARASRLAVDILAERTQRENPRAIPDARREKCRAARGRDELPRWRDGACRSLWRLRDLRHAPVFPLAFARLAAAEPDDLMGNWRGWSAKLSRPIQLKDGTQLQTLADVRDFISGQPEHIQERTFWQHATHLLTMPLTAATSKP